MLAFQSLSGATAAVVDRVVADVVAALPSIVTGVLFVAVAWVLVRLALRVARRLLDGLYAEEDEMIVDLFVAVAGLFLWFGVALAFLKIIGMGDVAASLGTATGFVALGVSYALSNMLADTVAGVYLLRDPDFTVGDEVVVDGTTGTVTGIQLRKCRLRVDDDTVVVANRDVEKRWRKLDDYPAEG
jgi:small-conductance mechanosensitive channel